TLYSIDGAPIRRRTRLRSYPHVRGAFESHAQSIQDAGPARLGAVRGVGRHVVMRQMKDAPGSQRHDLYRDARDRLRLSAHGQGKGQAARWSNLYVLAGVIDLHAGVPLGEAERAADARIDRGSRQGTKRGRE